MFFSARALLKPLLVTVSIAALLSVASLLMDWHASRSVSTSSEEPAFVLHQEALWAVGTVLATAVTVVVLLVLAARANSVPSPWCSALRFGVLAVSPFVGLLLSVVLHSLFTLPHADTLTAVYITPSKLHVTLPAALGLGALIGFGRTRRPLNGPA